MIFIDYLLAELSLQYFRFDLPDFEIGSMAILSSPAIVERITRLCRL